MSKNPNHPKIGSTIKVEPIRTERDIKNIKRLLRDKPRDLAIFTIGINTNLRASDIVSLTVGQFKGKCVGDYFSLRELKTGKPRNITINKSVLDVIKPLLGDRPDTEALFVSAKTKTALKAATLTLLVKTWCKEINLRGNYGAHTLRKSMGFFHRTVFNTDIPTLMMMFNHSTQKQTLDYLGIQDTDIRDAYMREI